MLIPCLKAQAVFPTEGLLLRSPAGASLFWDCHDGATHVLMVGGLQGETPSEAAAEAGISCTLSLSPPEQLIREMECYAADMKLSLRPIPGELSVLSEKLTLAACHVPEKRLFIFSEKAELTVHTPRPLVVELQALGPFRTTRVLSQEAKLLLHLDGLSALRLLSYLFTVAREAI